jgi:glycosyltransferase involved in cell wall biosynthesis
LNPRAIFIFTPGFASSEGDTTCIPFLQQLCLSLKNVEPDCTVVIFAFQYPFNAGDYYWNGVRVISFGGQNRKGIARTILWLKVVSRFMTLRKQYEVAGIFSIWLSECALIGKILASSYRIKHFTWIVGQDARATNKYIRWIRPQAQSLVAFSKFIAMQMDVNFGLRPGHIIRNGVNSKIFPPLKTADREISVMGAGSLIALKNYSLFIEVISHAKQKFPIGKAVIAGAGPENENLYSLIEKKQLGNNIQLTGNIEHKDVLNLMNNSRIFLHTSNYDSNASVLHEALCAGCKVVSTCPIDPAPAENFYLVNDENEIVAKVIELLSQENSGFKSVVMNTMDNSATQILELFNA